MLEPFTELVRVTTRSVLCCTVDYEEVQAVRYAESMTLNIELQESSGDGLIRPPYLKITYATATRDDYVNRRTKEVS